MRKKLKYCPYCSARFEDKKEHGFKRHYCPKCGDFFYDNPLVGTAVVVVQGGQLLLVKRNIHPGRGMWALPGGFAEQGETVQAAAKRELFEETGLKAKKAEIVSVLTENSFMYGTVIVPVIKVEGYTGKLKPGKDELEAKFFNINKLPLLAFTSHRKAVKKIRRSEG
ncbi:MAG: NUDIX hydrolase [Candidatus Goldiibacteriota bacterium HGW-Goldbacteria-1]|jgi:ADP-ribose pyrophosphatase YjhB (NUDIX family)|nr:MAG: NUDIX hydrolase [Candidatus Goldiibacteriota bacterium HGW-Goldbacteria-1]